MKPTNEERREVARRLRENAEEHPKMQLILNVAFACDSLRPEGATDWNVTSHDAAMYLADLIEPDPERTCRPTHDRGRWECDECGCVIEPGFYPQFRGNGVLHYCPNCGSKVVVE